MVRWLLVTPICCLFTGLPRQDRPSRTPRCGWSSGETQHPSVLGFGCLHCAGGRIRAWGPSPLIPREAMLQVGKVCVAGTSSNCARDLAVGKECVLMAVQRGHMGTGVGLPEHMVFL